MVELVVMSVAPLLPWALALVLLVWAFALVLLPDASVQSLQLPDARLKVLWWIDANDDANYIFNNL